MQVNIFDIGKHIQGAAATQHVAAVAAGSGDNAYVDGQEFDLQSFEQRPVSAAIIVLYEAALAQTETLSLKTKVEDDIETGMATDLAVYAYDGAEVDHGVVATGETGGSTEIGALVRSVHLGGVRRFFRFSVHQDLSASGTDTNQLMTAVVFFSGEAPATDSV